ncbi:MAG: hypothetical protein KF871_16625 [Hydrogenophaga sp.]|uniref:hypothetical protein n=1 Tax=Hydrogenophaga sp. TaxID=1904254 RepID=UPI001D933312|nr:hypothetical protein [Hydrogenophaga sp.]MBX3611520.1 hypothetical protein [Hydrogenophaga sp.]
MPWNRCVLIACLAWAAGANAFAGEQDLAGLKLGMTPEQAKAALVAFGVERASIQEIQSSFRYGDGVKSFSTEPFLDRMTGGKRVRKGSLWVEDQFELSFAPPPKGGQLVLVRRTIKNPVDPPTVADYRAAILDKHGKPDMETPGSLSWFDPAGAVHCVRDVTDVSGVMSSIYMGNDKYGWRLNHLRNANKVRNPSECARVLSYHMLASPKSPAKQVRATLADVPGWGTAYLATLEWVEAQRQAAIKRREGSASKPRL